MSSKYSTQVSRDASLLLTHLLTVDCSTYQVREQTRMVDASSIVLSAEDGNSANANGGAQRRRKQLYPAPSLLPLF